MIDTAPPVAAEIAAPSMKRSTRRLLIVTFVVVSFLGSSLLFLVQPMVARFLLPLAGGSAALWNTAMVFFQVVLLAGYVFAHVSTNRLGLRRHPFLQIAVLAMPLLVLPIAVPGGWRLPADASPALWVLLTLGVMVGLPFFALATSSPTLQRWFSATDHPEASDPYFLYSAGNIGSALALLGYPFVLEPWLSLRAQAWLWAGGYVLFVVGFAACAILVRRYRSSTPVETAKTAPPVAGKRRAYWLLLAFVPSALMLGVTRHIATDLASFPLLWIVPLFLYLTTFVIAFGRPAPWVTTAARWAVWIGAVPMALSFRAAVTQLGAVVALHLVWFSAAALLAHLLLAADRPAPARLTEFYTLVSVGGALGGVFAALIAPTVFDVVLEYPIAIALVLVIARSPSRGTAILGNRRRLLSFAAALLAVTAVVVPGQTLLFGGLAAVALALGHGGATGLTMFIAALTIGALLVPPAGTVVRDRSFFGVYSVHDVDGTRVLRSGTTWHGSQVLDAPELPTMYYAEPGPVGQVLTARDDVADVGVVGLGAGTLVLYGEPGDTYTVYEIDPLVVEVAADPEVYSYLARARADVNVEVADGRRGLAETADRYDVLVIDAFSSDAIPVHLMTREAVELYMDRVKPGGVVVLHISNRHFDLTPVLGRIASELDLYGVEQFYEPTDAELEQGAGASHWVVLAESAAAAAEVTAEAGWEPLPTDGPLWTDDYSNILGVLDL